MTWLSIISLNKPSDKIWWADANPERAAENINLLENLDVTIIYDNGTDQNTVKITFIYSDEQHYNDVQALYPSYPFKEEIILYHQENNIIDTRIYLGPSDQYTQ